MVDTFNFTTGPASVPDVGTLSYNGCTFSPLYETKISGKAVKDNANRTVKFMEYTLSADGYVTLPAGASDINPVMVTLRNLLTAQGGALDYRGRGFDLVVNAPGGNFVKGSPGLLDVAWGPIPELIEFQPLGAGRSAKVQWRVTVRIPEIAKKGPGILQLNYETTVAYGEDRFSSLSVRGTMEVAITRSPTQKGRGLTYTVDDYRDRLEGIITSGIDLDKFRITRSEFNVSRDKRTLEWDVAAEERPYMDPPPGCTIARGTYNVRPANAGMGLVKWLCTLKATYTVRPGIPRRVAWLAWLALVRFRMRQSDLGLAPEKPPKEPDKKVAPGIGNLIGVPALDNVLEYQRSILAADPLDSRKLWLIDFSIDEGLYLDSKTITFSATWRIITQISHILLASGVWRKLPENAKILGTTTNLWAASVRSISGTQSWLANKLDPSLDVIVDFGGGLE